MDGLETIKRLNFCDCGNPDDAYEALKEVLATYHTDENEENGWQKRCERTKVWLEKVGDQNGTLLLYFLTSANLLEHGGSVYSSWLTTEGKEVLEFLSDFGTNPDDWK